VTAGVFTASGDLDLIVANYNDDTVSILTGKGDGTFNGKSDKAVGSGPVSITTGNFNAGGNLDIAVANFVDNTVSVLLGNGTGGFAAAVSYDVGLGPISVASGDFNGTTAGGGDSKVDLAVANRGDDNITILRGNGDGTFVFAQNYTTGTGPASIVVAYFNGDSLDDIATANEFGNNASIFLAVDETDAPTGSVTIDEGDWTSGASVNLSLSATEESGGAIEMCISNTAVCGGWIAYATSKPWTLAAGDGIRTVYAWFRDDRSNVSSAYFDVILVDSTAPGKPIVINNNDDFTNSTSVTLTLGGSGSTHVRICNTSGCTDPGDDADWVAYTGSTRSWTLLSGDGTKTVYARFKNAHTTSAQFSDMIILDTTAPTGSVVIEGGKSATLVTSVDLTLSATEESGGAIQMCISNSNASVCPAPSAWEAFSSSKAWDLTAGEGNKTVYAWFKDARGNVSSAYSDTIALNTSKPTGSIIVNSGTLSTNALAVTLTMTKSASAFEMCVSNSTTCTVWTPVRTTMAWTLDGTGGDGTKTVYAWFRSEDGIVSDQYSDTIIYDTTPPSSGSVQINSNDPSTNSATVTLTLAATDVHNAIAEMCISNTNSCTNWIQYATSKSWTLTAGDGTKTVYAWFKDAQGNAMSSPVTDDIILDTTSPTGSIVIDGGNVSTLSTSVSLTIAASDGTGVGSIKMCVSNTNGPVDKDTCPGTDGWEDLATPKAWTLTAGEATKTVYIWFKDGLGNVSSGYNDTIEYYAGLPTGSILVDSGAVSTGTLAVTLSLTRSGSVTEMCISNSNSSVCPAPAVWEVFSASKAWTLDGTGGDGNKPVYAWFRINASIVSGEYSDSIAYDTTPPDSGSVSINGGAATTSSTTVTLTLSATDALTALTEMCISNTNSCTNWIVYSTSKSWELTAGNGTKTVYVWFKDAQGNVTADPATDTIGLDSAAPTGTVVINRDDAATNTEAVTLTLSATDDSTVTQMCISNTAVCGGWIAYATSKSWTLAAGDGIKTVRVWFKDEWGNATAEGSPNTDTIVLDKTAPASGSISINTGAAATASTAVTLTLSATDATSVTQMCISNTTTCTEWVAFVSPTAWTLTAGDGIKTVRAWFKDSVGNANATAVSDTITLDTTAPTGSIVINSSDAKTSSVNVTLTLAAAGASHMCISNTNDVVDKETCPGSGWIAFATSKPWALTAGDGTKTVRVWFKDALDNTDSSPYSDTIDLDTAAPTGASVTINGGDYTNSTSVTLTLVATGATEMCISNTVTCTAWIAYTTSKAWTLSSGAGLKTVYAKFRDDLGNTSAQVNDTITFDNTAPTNGTATAANDIASVVLRWSGFADTGGSGIASYKIVYSTTSAPANCSGTDINNGKMATFTHTGLVNGTTYYYRVCAVDYAGKISTGATASAMAVAEKAAPVGTVSIAAGADAVKTTAVTLTIAATDANAPIQMCVSNTATCAIWETLAVSKTWTLTSGNGTKTVKVWFRDKFNNTTVVPASDTIIYDTTVPVNGTLTATADDTKVDLSWAGFSDAGSGIASYKLVFSTTSSPSSCATGTQIGGTIGSGTSTYSHTGLTNGTLYYYRLCAIDELGYVSTGAVNSAIPTPEKIAPTGSISINSGALYANKTGVSLTLTVSDAPDNSSPYQMCISNADTCSSWIAYVSPKTWTLTSGNGEKTVNVWFRDKYRNTSIKYSASITLDGTVPTGGTLNVSAMDSQNDLAWNGFTEVGSSIASYKLVYSTASMPASCSAGTVLYTGSNTSYSHIGLINGTTYYYRVCAVDQANNVSAGATATGKWVPETVPPTGTVVINSGASYTGSTSVTLTLSATDASSTVTQMCISNTTTCTSWIAYATSKTWTLASSTTPTRTVNVWYRDEWGNTSVMNSDSIIVDSVKPVNGTIIATPSDSEVQLSWAGFADASSGLASYKVVFSTSAAPSSCSGTGIYTGPDSVTTFTHLGLTNGTKYYYRVCAVDNVGNMSTGTTVPATPGP